VDASSKRPWVDRFLGASNWVIGVGMVAIIVLTIIRFAFL
jgi:hypothetical protein